MIQRIKSFFKEAAHEVKQVNWPTVKETRQLTLTIIGLSLVVAVLLGILDFIFTYLLEKMIL
jgi:preprotein translocase subunit SecE